MIPLFKVFMHGDAKRIVGEVLESGFVGQGERVERFEEELAKLLGHDVVTVNSCTSAIDLALHMIGVGPGDEVLTTPMTCTATNTPIVRRGAKPVWCDVDAQTGLIDPRDVAKKVTSKTKAVIGVDWGGAECDWEGLKRVGLPVVEDAAHALLTKTGGDYVCYSFQAIKHLTCGDGGGLVSPEPDRARLLRWYGLDRRSKQNFRCEQDITEIGYKYHMNDICAGIGLGNIGSAEWVVGKHRENAEWYFRNLPRKVLPRVESVGSSWWVFTIFVDSRAEFEKFCRERGVMVGQVHKRNDVHSGFREVCGKVELPGVGEFDEKNCAIPVGWWVGEREREKIGKVVEEWCRG